MRGILGLFLVLVGAGCGEDEPRAGGLCDPPPLVCAEAQYFTQWDCNPGDEDLDGDGIRDLDVRLAGREVPDARCILEREYCHPGGLEAVEQLRLRPTGDPRPAASRAWKNDVGGVRLASWTKLEANGDELRHFCCRGSGYLGGIRLRTADGDYTTLDEFSCPPFGTSVPSIMLDPGELPPVDPMIED